MAPSTWLSYSWDFLDQADAARIWCIELSDDNGAVTSTSFPSLPSSLNQFAPHSNGDGGRFTTCTAPGTIAVGRDGNNMENLEKDGLLRRGDKSKQQRGEGFDLCRTISGRQQRRSYFRSWKGESKEALRQTRVLSVLRTVPPLQSLTLSKSTRMRYSGEDAKRDVMVEDVPHQQDVPKKRKSSDGFARAVRKRSQVQSISVLLRLLDLPRGSVVVDFGSGSGALVLPLAALFPDLEFVAVDSKYQSISLLCERAEVAGLSNIRTFNGWIHEYSEKFSACVALHACGQATDDAMERAICCRAAYIMSPCCVGKLNRRSCPPCPLCPPCPNNRKVTKTIGDFTSTGEIEESSTTRRMGEASLLHEAGGGKKGNGRQSADNGTAFRILDEDNNEVGRGERDSNTCYKKSSTEPPLPQSQWLQHAIHPGQFSLIAQMADWSSYDYSDSSAVLHRMCKTLVELDRNEAARENGYSTYLLRLSNSEAGVVGVGDILVGVHGKDPLVDHMERL